MPDEQVPGTPGTPAPGAPDKGQGGGKDERSYSRAEFESLRRERDEARESERFWATRARGGDQVVADEPEEQIETADLIPEITGDDSVDQAIFSNPDKWVEAVAKGPGAIQAFIRKAGYVTATEAADIAAKVAQRTVQQERQKMTSDNVILRDFPDLGKQDSDLFKATAVELKRIVSLDPRSKNSPATLYAAATAAAAKLEAKRPARSAEADDDDDRYERPEDETDRRRRADSQDGSRSRGRGASDDSADMLGPEAREVLRQMGVSEAEFSEQSKLTRGERPGRGSDGRFARR